MPKDIVEMLPDVGNMRQSVLPERNAEHASYARYMVEMANDQREENRKLQEIRAKRAGVDLKTYLTQQAASTQATLDRPKEKDLSHWLREVPKEAQINKPDENGHIEMPTREISPQEYAAFNATKNNRNTRGQSEKSSAGEERKEAAVNAFICSPGVSLENLNPEERARIQKPTAYEEPPLLAIETKPVKKAGWDFQGGSTWLGNLLWKWRHRNDRT